MRPVTTDSASRGSRPRIAPGDRPLPAIIAHRGASGYRPEHTAAAYELAFALGADAVEPDIVATRDGVLVIRHDVEISATTDVASRPEFAALRTTKEVDGAVLTGWFTEDFTWAQLATLRCVERLAALRPLSATFDGRYGVLRLSELLDLVTAASARLDRPLGIVAELKHATYFDSLGLPLDELFPAELAAAGWDRSAPLAVESFEQDILVSLAAAGVDADLVYLVEAHGAPADRVARSGAAARAYDDDVTDAGLAALAACGLTGVSVDLSRMLRTTGDGALVATDIARRAAAAGLQTYCWTLRPENAFLPPSARLGGGPGSPGDWRRVFELVQRSGAAAVFADHPDLAASVRETRARE
ncbi:glycerophosphodiester phosphodiesterase family protein [Leifsonia shinshuensis]|uniref:glycerophosphodiester phosphodiesterase n=1 Tax=Leifsonia shinshuensis TaxID=150026 RepID=A0A853CQG0_9MICO|nr:glycerophosphodiester phosphodiesterase family protein [Leifsonia shinshuensis]NYJ22529.1 glycerophosphoryl diester phosphodiesterase [Leifsonia shinshuensis]